MNSNLEMFRGFRKELTKKAELDAKGGLQGATLGALIGAILGGVGPLVLAKILANNAGLAALLGGVVGTGGGAVAGSLLGKKVEQQKTGSGMDTLGASLAAKMKGVGSKIVSTPAPKFKSLHVSKEGEHRASAPSGIKNFLKTSPKINVTV